MEQAHEEHSTSDTWYKQQQLQAIREQHKHMMDMCEKDIEHHEDQIARNKEQIEKYKKLIKKEGA
ncbi:hypothetical protein QZH41_018384, partial [Actinostola sp. cb2023]